MRTNEDLTKELLELRDMVKEKNLQIEELKQRLELLQCKHPYAYPKARFCPDCGQLIQ